jgi:hypothetical protein
MMRQDLAKYSIFISPQEPILTMTSISFFSMVLLVFAAHLLQVHGFCVYNSLAPGNVLYLEEINGFGNDPTS